MNHGTVLVVEDDIALREVLADTLKLAKYKVMTSENGQDALHCLKDNDEIGLIVSDVQMQPMDGHEFLKTARPLYPELPIILMTAYGTVEKAVQAMHNGAVDYLVKPFEADALVELVSRFIVPGNRAMEQGIIAVDVRSQEMTKVAQRVALTDATVMITGESGVGKEVVSRYIHQQSSRAKGPFVAINCAAIPQNMLEAVLFGYEKGAFTGAYLSKPGKFEQAQGGTLLLDEITEMDLSLQAKLLRVLQEREVERLGSQKMIPLNVRILATTNRDIKQTVLEGNFREDLFYRLNVFPLNILPLRDRPNDILPLAKGFIASNHNEGRTASLSDAAASALLAHNWPGNVRELDNVIQRALILKTGDCINVGDIRFEHVTEGADTQPQPERSVETFSHDLNDNLSSDLRDHEKNLIISALKTKSSRKEVAEKLGISPRTLRYKLARLRDAGVTIPV